MLKKTVDRIVNNFYNYGMKTVIGRYTYSLGYRAETESWCMYRCRTEDVGRTWIDADGDFLTAWELVMEVK